MGPALTDFAPQCAAGGERRYQASLVGERACSNPSPSRSPSGQVIRKRSRKVLTSVKPARSTQTSALAA